MSCVLHEIEEMLLWFLLLWLIIPASLSFIFTVPKGIFGGRRQLVFLCENDPNDKKKKPRAKIVVQCEI